MIVVADSSPLIVLLNIGQIEILPQLFGEIVIPPAVQLELVSQARPLFIRNFISNSPAWLRVERPSQAQAIPQLHAGESEAISLAIELRADLVLIDERRAYHEAVVRRLNAVGTIGVLERAAAQGLLNLGDTFDRIKKTDFWISQKLLDERLKYFQQNMREPSP
jgi:predicted nucleic acid-binding protein